MKFRKPSPDKLMGHSEVMDFYDSLPDEFEILGPGEVAVKWPEGITKGRLNDLAKFFAREGRTIAAGELHALAAIAPERKKRRVSLWEAGGRIHVWGEHDTAGPPWRKVAGPIEIDD